MAEQTFRHLTEEMLWSKIKSGQSLEPAQFEHIRDCRDCRELVQVISTEAPRKGFSFRIF
jgi:hypothetical protein